MAFNERWTREAIEKYTQSVRPSAAYLPENIKFLADTNGITVDDVQRILFEASYMVLGLGDVYLGAPCAVPVNPLHRLVTPKYNPARTFTWEGTVGIGGAYMCIYPMSSPGGYQLVGRTLPIWNSFGKVVPFTPTKPWLLRNFDQVRFHEVSESELERLRADFVAGRYALDMQEEMFDMAAYNAHLVSIKDDIAAWRAQQAAADKVMRAKESEIVKRLEARGYSAGGGMSMRNRSHASLVDGITSEFDEPHFAKVTAPFTANVWEVCCCEGDMVVADQQLVVLEAMKMETPVLAPKAGRIVKIEADRTQLVQRSDMLLVIDTSQGIAAAAD